MFFKFRLTAVLQFPLIDAGWTYAQMRAWNIPGEAQAVSLTEMKTTITNIFFVTLTGLKAHLRGEPQLRKTQKQKHQVVLWASL